MLFFELTHFRKIRIWFDKLDQLSFVGELSKNRKYPSSSTIGIEKKSQTLILELMVPRGGRIEYGLLGVVYNHNKISNLVAKVRFQNKQSKQIFKESLMKEIEPIYIGLPEEYSDYVLFGVDNTMRTTLFRLTGTLDFCYAAHGLVSSSGVVYKKLAQIIPQLLTIPKEQVNEQLILNLLDGS